MKHLFIFSLILSTHLPSHADANSTKSGTMVLYTKQIANPIGLAFNGLGSFVVAGFSTLFVYLLTDHLSSKMNNGGSFKTSTHHLMDNGLHTFGVAVFTGTGIAGANQAWQSWLSAWQQWYVTPEDQKAVKFGDL